MSYMFYDCSMLTELDGIGGLDTGNAVSMTCMFAECSSLYSLDLSGFDTSAVENLSRMFQNCRSLNSLDISGFVFGGNSVYIDIFAGTRWEGSSPPLNDAAETRSALYILDTQGCSKKQQVSQLERGVCRDGRWPIC